MTDHEIRDIIAQQLEYACLTVMRDKKLTPVFLEGRHDIALGELEMDSLAEMELCIAIEINTGVSIVPNELQGIGTLNSLVDVVRKGMQ
jgi:acyl carrier protein